MNALWRVWDHFEEGFIAFLLAAMTLVTFVYVVLNNLYTVFYSLGDTFPAAEDFFFALGDYIIGLAQSMTWSSALTRALFAWLIFSGLACAPPATSASMRWSSSPRAISSATSA